MGIWFVFLSILVGIWLYSLYKLRQKNRIRQQERNKNESKLKAKDSENIRLKEELLKIKSGKDKLKENLEKYQKENKRLQGAARKKRKKRTDAGKRREVSPANKRSGKPKGANGGGLKNPDPKEIDYTREWYLEECPECSNSLKGVNPFDHHDHYIRDFEKIKRGLMLVYIRHVIYRYKCPHCGKIVSKYFGKLKNARYGIGLIAFVLYERLQRGGSWEGIRTTMYHIIRTKECVPTIKSFIDWIRKYEDEMVEVYEAFLAAIKDSPFAYVDETGIPLDSTNWWLWVIVATEVVLYLPSESRGSETIKDIFHEYKGILISDFWSAYNKLNVEQQKCLQHVVTELRKISMRELDTRDKALKKLKKDNDAKAWDPADIADTPKKRGRPVEQPASLLPEKREKLEQTIAWSEKAAKQVEMFANFFKQAWKKHGNDLSVYTPIGRRASVAEAETL